MLKKQRKILNFKGKKLVETTTLNCIVIWKLQSQKIPELQYMQRLLRPCKVIDIKMCSAQYFFKKASEKVLKDPREEIAWILFYLCSKSDCRRPAFLLKMNSFKYVFMDFTVFRYFLQFLGIGRTPILSGRSPLDDNICMQLVY